MKTEIPTPFLDWNTVLQELMQPTIHSEVLCK